MNKKKVIIDCDPGIDDTLALMYLLKNPEIEVLGINVSSGNCSNIQGVKNVLALFKEFEFPYFPPIFTVKGLHVNSEGNYIDTPETHGRDGLGETYYSDKVFESDLEKVKYNFNEWMNDVLSKEEDITFLALGPLTSLHEFMNLYPQSFKKFSKIYSMGGTLLTLGNTTPFAEWNYYWDPISVEGVLDFLDKENMKGFVMVPQDSTAKVVWTPNITKILERSIKNEEEKKILDFIVNILKFYDNFHWQYEKKIGSVINDPLAATAILIEDKYEVTRYLSASVVTEGEEKGRVLLHKKGRKEVVRAIWNLKSYKFWFEFLRVLFPSINQNILEDQLIKLRKYHE